MGKEEVPVKAERSSRSTANGTEKSSENGSNEATDSESLVRRSSRPKVASGSVDLGSADLVAAGFAEEVTGAGDDNLDGNAEAKEAKLGCPFPLFAFFPRSDHGADEIVFCPSEFELELVCPGFRFLSSSSELGNDWLAW